MENKNNIDFENEFKNLKRQENKNTIRDKLKERRPWYSLLILCLYVILNALIALIITFGFLAYGKSKPEKFTLSPTSQIINEIYLNPDKVGISTVSPFTNSSNAFKESFYNLSPVHLSSNKDIWLIISRENKHASKLLNILNEKDKTITLFDNWQDIIKNENIKILTDTDLALLQPLLTNYNNLEIKRELSFTSTTSPREINTITNYFFGGSIAFISTLLITVVIVGLMWKDFAYDFKYKLSKNLFKSFLFIIGGLVLLFTSSYFSELIIELIVKVGKIDFISSENQKLINLLLENPNQAVYMKLTAILLAPIIEELIFRKTIFKLIKSKGMAIYVSSLTFGLIHVYPMIINPEIMLINLIPYFMGGLVLSSIYALNRKNIYIPIVVHMLFNLIGLII